MNTAEQHFRESHGKRGSLIGLWDYTESYFKPHTQEFKSAVKQANAGVSSNASPEFGGGALVSPYDHSSNLKSLGLSGTNNPLGGSFDSTPAWSLSMFISFLTATLTSSRKIWSKFEHRPKVLPVGAEPDADEIRKRDLVFDSLTQGFHSELKASNYYGKNSQITDSKVTLGNSCYFLDEGVNSLFNFHVFNMRDVIFEEGYDGKVQYVTRKEIKTLNNLCIEFAKPGEDLKSVAHRLGPRFGKMFEAQRFTQEVTCYHRVYPIDSRKKGAKNPVSSIEKAYGINYIGEYSLEGEPGIIRTDRYKTMPYICGRWIKTEASPYGMGQTALALPDARYLNDLKEIYLRGSQKRANPPWNVPVGVSGKPISTRPNALNYHMDAKDKPTPIVAFDIAYAFQATQVYRGDFPKLFLLDFFSIIQNKGGLTPKTATEVDAILSEGLLFLSPILGMHESEELPALMARGLEIMSKSKRYSSLFEFLGDEEYTVAYTSDIASAQNHVELNSLIRGYARAFEYSQGRPDSLDIYDHDSIIKKIWSLENDSSFLLLPSEVQGIRQKRQQQIDAVQKTELDEKNSLIGLNKANTLKTLGDTAGSEGIENAVEDSEGQSPPPQGGI